MLKQRFVCYDLTVICVCHENNSTFNCHIHFKSTQIIADSMYLT